MSLHRNAKLGLAGRYALVSAIAGGMTLKVAAAAFSVSPAAAHRWWHRWLEASEEASATTTRARSSRPLRPAYVELHPDEKAATVTGFVERPLIFFADHGFDAKRLMTDNAFAYVHNRALRELLARNGIRHLTTQPYRPRRNGKVERFHQTMARESAYGLTYR
jgi:transposase